QRILNLYPGSVFVSAVEAGGLEPLRRSLLATGRAERPLVEVRFPASDGRVLAELHRRADVVEQRTEDDAIVVSARMDEVLAGQLGSGGYAVSGPVTNAGG